MILLDGRSLTKKAYFRPESMSLSLEERSSSASMTIGPAAPTLKAGDWLLDDCEPGEGIVWIVRTIDQDFGSETRTVSLSHIIQSLKDTIIFGEVKAGTMAGDESATTCTGREAAEYALGYQSDWQLGNFAYPVEMAFSFNGDSVFEALETVTETCGDAEWNYDLSAYPFTLHITHQESEASCEMRPGRNISSVKRTIDRSGMYTRLYPVGENDLHITGDYVQKNVSTYGLIEKTETESSIGDEDWLRAWAQARLERHCEPKVTIEIDGLELSESTGEDLDHLRLGKVCRCPLPEYSTQIAERITKLSWKDKLSEPENVTVTLANNRENLSMKLAKSESSSSKSSRASVKTDSEIHKTIEDTANGLYNRLDITASYLRSEISDTANGIYSRIEQTASYIRSEVSDTANGIYSRIEQTASYIRSEVVDEIDDVYTTIDQTAMYIRQEARDTANGIYSRIEETASYIRAEVSDTANGIYSRIEETASYIRTEVSTKTGSLRSMITQTASRFEVAISGVVDSEGKVTAASIAAAIDTTSGASIITLSADHIKLTAGSTLKLSDVLTVTQSGDVTITGDVYSTGAFHPNGISMAAGSSLSFTFGTAPPATYTFSSSNVPGMIVDAAVADNTLTLTKMNGDTVTFSKATTLSGAWSGSGLYTATARQETTTVGTVTTQLYGVTTNGSPTQNLLNRQHVLAPVKVVADVPEQGSYSDGTNVLTTNVDIDASIAFSHGWEDGLDTVVWGSENSGSAIMTMSYRPGSSSTSDNYKYYRMHLKGSKANSYISLRNSNSSDDTAGYEMAKLNVGSLYTEGYNDAGGSTVGYNQGWAAAYSVTSVPSTQNTSRNYITIGIPDSTVDTPDSLSYYVTVDDDYAYLHYLTASGTVVARTTNSAYGHGWLAALNSTNHNWGVAHSTNAIMTISYTPNRDAQPLSEQKYYKMYLKGSGSSSYVSLRNSTSGDTSGSEMAVLGVGDLYTGGRSAATVSGLWSQGTITASNEYNDDNEWYSTLKTSDYTVSWTGTNNNTGSIAVQAYNNGSSTATSTGATITFDASTPVYSGKASVTLEDPTWNTISGDTPSNRTVTVKTANRTNSSGTAVQLQKEIALYLTQGSWSSNKKNVNMRAGSNTGTIYATIEVDASSLVSSATYAGKASVTLKDPTWATAVSAYPQNNTVTVTTSGRTNSSGTTAEESKSIALYLTQGTFSSHKKYVTMRVGSTTGTIRARIQVDATTEYDNGYDTGHTRGLYDYYHSQYWSHDATTGVVKVPNVTNTGMETWFTYTPGGGGTTSHSPKVSSNNWGSIDKSSTAASSFISGRTKANKTMLQSGKYYVFSVDCGGSGQKNYYVET